MEAKAILRNLRIAPKKTRLVAGLVRGRTAGEAVDVLRFLNKKAALPLRKLIESAMANARSRHTITDEAARRFRIARLLVDGGAQMKRWMPRAHGRATMIRKRFSHVTVVLSDAPPATRKKRARKELKV